MHRKTTKAPSPRARQLLRIATIALIFVSIALLLSVDSAYQALQRLLSHVEPIISGHPLLGAAVFVLLSAVSAILAFFSSALLVPAAVYAWGKVLTIALLWLGWLLGGMAMYGLGRSLRRPSGSRRTRLPARFAAYLPKRSSPPGFSVVLLWQLALPSEIPGYLCGYLGVSFRNYVLALALGELPYAIGAVLVGESVVNRQLGWLMLLGVAFAVLAYLLGGRIRQRTKQGA